MKIIFQFIDNKNNRNLKLYWAINGKETNFDYEGLDPSEG